MLYNCRPLLSLLSLIARWWKKGFYHIMKLGILGKIYCPFLRTHTCIVMVHPSVMFSVCIHFNLPLQLCPSIHCKITAMFFFSLAIYWICIKRTHLEASIRDDKGNRNSGHLHTHPFDYPSLFDDLYLIKISVYVWLVHIGVYLSQPCPTCLSFWCVKIHIGHELSLTTFSWECPIAFMSLKNFQSLPK